MRSSNVVEVFAFILKNNLDCKLLTHIYNEEKIIQYFIFDGSLDALEKIAFFCNKRDVPFTFRWLLFKCFIV